MQFRRDREAFLGGIKFGDVETRGLEISLERFQVGFKARLDEKGEGFELVMMIAIFIVGSRRGLMVFFREGFLVEFIMFLLSSLLPSSLSLN